MNTASTMYIHYIIIIMHIIIISYSSNNIHYKHALLAMLKLRPKSHKLSLENIFIKCYITTP